MRTRAARADRGNAAASPTAAPDMNAVRHRGDRALLALLLCAAIAPAAGAADRLWIGATGTPPGDGTTFIDPLNWFPREAPGAGDRAIVGAVVGTVILPGGTVVNDRLLVGGVELPVILDLSGGLYQLASSGTAGDARSLVVAAGATQFGHLVLRGGTLSGGTAAIAAGAGSVATWRIEEGAVAALLGELAVGDAGVGMLRLDGQLVSAAATVGAQLGGFGDVRLDLPSARWTLLDDLVVARDGFADVVVANGGRIVGQQDLRIATGAGSFGSLLATDSGSSIEIDGEIVVGGDLRGGGGTAVFSIEASALVHAGTTTRINPAGTIDLFAAQLRTPTLIVEGGLLSIGERAAVLVAGAGEAPGAGLHVGAPGSAGSALVAAGGTIAVDLLVVGPAPTAAGSLLLRDAGTSVIVFGDLLLGGKSVPNGRLGSDALLALEGGELDVQGTIVVGQRGLVRLDGGAAHAATVRVEGEGRLAIRFDADSEIPPIEASQGATLDGALFVELGEPSPVEGASTAVVVAPQIAGAPRAVIVPDAAARLAVDAPVLDEGALRSLRLRLRGLEVAAAFAPPASTTLGQAPVAIVAERFDADETPDLLVCIPGDGTPGSVELLLGEAAGQGLPPGFALAAQTAVGADPRALAAADLDGDDRIDAVVANAGDGTLSVLLNNLGGAAGPPLPAVTAIPIGGAPSGVAIADFDGDQLPDIVATNGLMVALVRGTGGGTFGTPKFIGAGFDPRAVVAADLDGDGVIDLAVANYGLATPTSAAQAATVSIHRGLGGGFFAPPVFHEVGPGPTALLATDLDGDGRPEIVTASATTETISLLVGLPRGGFAPAIDIAVGGIPRALAHGDFDDDGDDDLLALVDAGAAGRQATLVRNDTFDGRLALGVRPSFIALPGSAAGLAAVDADLDGVIDLIACGAAAPEADDPDGLGLVATLLATPIRCPADLDGNGIIDGIDLGLLLADWGKTGEGLASDLDGDGIVDGKDLGVMLCHWGPCPTG